MATLEMSVGDWIKIADNPRQRNTEKRAQFAVRRHLARASKMHRFVYAASKSGDVLCKLDGHTRALLWERGELESPSDGKVTVILIEVNGLAEAKSLYDELDSQVALKRPRDQIYGATREHKMTLASPLLRSCSFAVQLKIAETGGAYFPGDVYKLVGKWKEALSSLDRLNLSSNYTILISLMLLAIRKDGVEVAGPFFTDLDANSGVKTERGSDGVEMLHKHLAIRRAEGCMSGHENLRQILSRGWSAYSGWKDGKRWKHKEGLKGADVQAVVEELGGKVKVS